MLNVSPGLENFQNVLDLRKKSQFFLNVCKASNIYYNVVCINSFSFILNSEKLWIISVQQHNLK